MKIGALFALLSVITWSVNSVVTRYCLLNYDINILVFTSLQIFSGGVALLIIREPVTTQSWKSGVKYSWLYTWLQIFRNFFLAAIYLYISSTETSLLINLEVIITTILTYFLFKRTPNGSDIIGMLVILTGIVLFLLSLPEAIRGKIAILVVLAAFASCIRAVIVEKTTITSPNTTTRQKCGISGYTMFWGGFSVICILSGIALFEHFFAKDLMNLPLSTLYLPKIKDIINPAGIISACLTGLLLTSLSTYLYYATLQTATAETFMTFRAFQPMLTYSLEVWAATYYFAMRPDLSTKDFILAGVIIFGSFLILITPPKRDQKQYMTN
ncbi:DMT family transporter [Gabonibacter chumensis]|uniref:DMT family transporter n=1 Tax=Gabonibacter chumensis TaxID=2972474 RepID=UPI002572C942|nr:DMT family transporter [Gabonibacter chumensis]MCR9012540.1 DMT family transporter [Gabonibacter chumensis]